ncbi:MAG: opacity protein-like surface antigen [Bacteroidia bacterium]|jgi:opacity protein-like surface antigen|tara:strand:- start:1715 stop:2335 length:621 start_codon:yes stop_codon:yes gene_type:complete
MQKFILIIGLICISSLAQDLAAQSFGASLLAGANFSQVDGDQLGGYNKLGVNLGVQIDRKLKEDWTAAFEIRFSMKGAKKVIDPEAPPTFTLKLSYHYLEVPLLIKYTHFDKFTPYAGPSIGVNVFNQRDENTITSKEEKLNRIEVGFHLGATYHLTDKIGIDLRHSYSLLSVRDFPIVVNSPTVFGRAGWFNRLFTAGIVYKLDR